MPYCSNSIKDLRQRTYQRLPTHPLVRYPYVRASIMYTQGVEGWGKKTYEGNYRSPVQLPGGVTPHLLNPTSCYVFSTCCIYYCKEATASVQCTSTRLEQRAQRLWRSWHESPSVVPELLGSPGQQHNHVYRTVPLNIWFLGLSREFGAFS